MSMKLAIVDVDETLVDTSARFERAKEAYIVTLQQSGQKFKEAKQEAETNFWRVANTPNLIELDKPLPGVEDALSRIEMAGYSIVLLSSRIEALRETTLTWFWSHLPEAYDRVSHGTLFLKPPAFQYTKTAVWKAGIAQMLAAFYGAEAVLFVDDDEDNRDAVLSQPETWRAWKVAASLDEAVSLLYPER